MIVTYLTLSLLTISSLVIRSNSSKDGENEAMVDD